LILVNGNVYTYRALFYSSFGLMDAFFSANLQLGFDCLPLVSSKPKSRKICFGAALNFHPREKEEELEVDELTELILRMLASERERRLVTRAKDWWIWKWFKAGVSYLDGFEEPKGKEMKGEKESKGKEGKELGL